jgi:hypothetical protein
MPDWCLAQIKENLFATRMGYALTEPKEITSYEDDKVRLCSYLTEAKKVLGYTLLAKNDFAINKRSWHISFINKNTESHHSPKVVYKDQQLHFHRFNSITDASYWLVIRYRTPK